MYYTDVMMKYKLYLVDVYENLQVEQVEADTETVALDLLALAARLNEFEPIGIELLAAWLLKRIVYNQFMSFYRDSR